MVSVIESFRLEKTSKIIESNFPLITNASHGPQCNIFSALEHLQGFNDSTSLGQCITTSSEKVFFLIRNLNLSWVS